MELWQYNAWCEAYRDRQNDELSIQIQAAYMCAYWNGFNKHKKSLQSVLNSIQKNTSTHKSKPKPIDKDKLAEKFKQMEELRTNGWTK